MHTLTERWKFSSAGRASALQAEGHRFEPYNFHQKDRVSGFFLLPAGKMSEANGGRLQGSAAGMVLLTSTKKTALAVFLLPTGKMSEANGGRLQGSATGMVLLRK